MATVYDRRRHHQLLPHKTTIFLPIFCRFSLKDINLSRHRRKSSLSDDPSSPKISCMGQVKRNNRVAAAATSTTTTHHHKYSKLKKLFSSKTLLLPTTASLPTATITSSAAAAAGRSKSCRGLKMKKECEGNDNYAKVVDVGELDPPLPVVKRAAPPRDEVNLWRRRFNGAAEIEKIHLPICKISQPPTV